MMSDQDNHHSDEESRHGAGGLTGAQLLQMTQDFPVDGGPSLSDDEDGLVVQEAGAGPGDDGDDAPPGVISASMTSHILSGYNWDDEATEYSPLEYESSSDESGARFGSYDVQQAEADHADVDIVRQAEHEPISQPAGLVFSPQPEHIDSVVHIYHDPSQVGASPLTGANAIPMGLSAFRPSAPPLPGMHSSPFPGFHQSRSHQGFLGGGGLENYHGRWCAEDGCQCPAAQTFLQRFYRGSLGMRYRRPLSIIHGRGHGSVPRVVVSPGVFTPFNGYGHGGAGYNGYDEPAQDENLAPGEGQDSDQVPDTASSSSSSESSSLTTYTEYTPVTTDSAQDDDHASDSDHDIEVIPELPPLRRGYSFGTEDMETEAPFPGRVDDPPDLVRDVPSPNEAQQEHADQVMVDWLTRQLNLLEDYLGLGHRLANTILAWREQFTREIALPAEPEPMPGYLYQRLMRGQQDPREPLEQVRPDQINPEQVFPDQINLEQVFPDQVNPEQVFPDQINLERGGLGQADLGQVNPAHQDPGEALHHGPDEAGGQVHEVADYRQYEDFPAQYEDFPAELPPQVFHADQDPNHEHLLLRIEGDPAAVMTFLSILAVFGFVLALRGLVDLVGGFFNS